MPDRRKKTTNACCRPAGAESRFREHSKNVQQTSRGTIVWCLFFVFLVYLILRSVTIALGRAERRWLVTQLHGGFLLARSPALRHKRPRIRSLGFLLPLACLCLQSAGLWKQTFLRGGWMKVGFGSELRSLPLYLRSGSRWGRCRSFSFHLSFVLLSSCLVSCF